MATLLLTAVGTAIGGPVGGAIGALIGQQADQAIFGSGTIEGPRLKELSVTTSSYGQPIARVFGRMRVPGTVIWSTDLIESAEKRGGGKGRPSTKTFSYSASFAVALSSLPVSSLGRIWADGELLRGAAGDLKTEGILRFYDGHGDDPVDPIIAADRGSSAPAFRDCAYVVFEDLQLADFGNRIPALTFEIMAESPTSVALNDIVPQAISGGSTQTLHHLRGFADEGGPLASSLSALNRIFPLSCVTRASGFSLAQVENSEPELFTLPPEVSHSDEEQRNRRRAERFAQEPFALRYYDENRDYQPGVQRAIGSKPNGREAMIDIPATMRADGARELANMNANRVRWQNEQLTWQTADLDPAMEPGSLVRIPDMPGRWLVKGWEWFDRGVELNLERLAPELAGNVSSDAGSANTPDDELVGPTLLSLFEVPSDGTSSSSEPLILAAASSATSSWKGAALFVERAGGLVPIGSAGSRRAVSGVIVDSLGPSNATHFEAGSSMLIDLPDDDLSFSETTIAGLAHGENRVLVGGEVLQFLSAEVVSPGRWQLSGLLRGRGGTENAAQNGHGPGTPVILLDERLTALDPSEVPSNASTRIAAIGLGDDEPVFADLSNSGLSRRPLTPVHPRRSIIDDGVWHFCWTRRARGQWLWEDLVDTPFVEEREAYLIGFGPTDDPFRSWETTEPEISFSEAERSGLVADFGPQEFWVKQIGTFSNSPAIHLATLS